MTRPVPLCHRTIGPSVLALFNLTWQWRRTKPEPCLGSACPMWVPVGDLGRCFEGPINADPWPDPASETRD